MNLIITNGDLLDQKVEVIVNAWNRNFIPWWLLLPQGVSAAIKKHAVYQPFIELGRLGMLPLGGAVETSADRLQFRAIIHVTGINCFWISSERAIRNSVRNALKLAQQKNYRSIAFPLIGSSTGGFASEHVLEIMRDEAMQTDYAGEVRLVRFKQTK